MGWWEAPGGAATVGDDGLDEAYRFLRRLASLYEDALGRKMTVDDLRATLEISLRANADESVFADFEEREVAAVAIKTAKRPKRQKYQPGDVFAVPLGDGRSAFGRIMQLSKRGDLVEIFRYVGDGARPSPDVTASGRLFHPIYVSVVELFEPWQWRVIASDPAYVPDDLEALRFVVGVPGDFTVVQGGRQTPVSDAEAEGLERKAFWRHAHTVRRIRETLGEPAEAAPA